MREQTRIEQEIEDERRAERRTRRQAEERLAAQSTGTGYYTLRDALEKARAAKKEVRS